MPAFTTDTTVFPATFEVQSRGFSAQTRFAAQQVERQRVDSTSIAKLYKQWREAGFTIILPWSRDPNIHYGVSKSAVERVRRDLIGMGLSPMRILTRYNDPPPDSNPTVERGWYIPAIQGDPEQVIKPQSMIDATVDLAIAFERRLVLASFPGPTNRTELIDPKDGIEDPVTIFSATSLDMDIVIAEFAAFDGRDFQGYFFDQFGDTGLP